MGLPLVIGPGGGETVFHQPERTIRILADLEELAWTWFRYEPGEKGPDPHVHRRHTDAFYVLEGELELGLGPDVRRVTAAAGAFAAAPPNVVHTFRNAGDATALFLNVHAPSMGFAEMLRAARDGADDDAEHFDQFEPPEDGGRPFADAVSCGPGEGDSLALGASRTVFKAEGSDVDGCFSLTENVLAAGFPGPVPHRHRALVDSFYVLEGAAALRLGNDEVTVGPGGFALVPPGNVHTFANLSEASVRLLNLMAPGGFEQYLRDLARTGGPPDPELMAELASRYDFEPA